MCAALQRAEDARGAAEEKAALTEACARSSVASLQQVPPRILPDEACISCRVLRG